MAASHSEGFLPETYLVQERAADESNTKIQPQSRHEQPPPERVWWRQGPSDSPFFETKSRRSGKDQRQRAPDSRVYSQWPHNTQREGRSISGVLRPSSHFSLPLSPPTPLHFQHSAANNVWLLLTPFEPPPPWLALGQWIPFPWNKPPDCGCCSVLLAAPLAHCWILRTHGNM